jgi:hypothetical protein
VVVAQAAASRPARSSTCVGWAVPPVTTWTPTRCARSCGCSPGARGVS